MKFASKLTATALVAVSLMFTGCGEGQIGCVDKSKVMTDSPRAKTATEEAKAEVDKILAAFDEKYPNQAEMSEEDAAKAQLELQRDLQKVQQKFSVSLENRFNAVVAEIAVAKNIDVVIENSDEQKNLFHGGIDITDDVIQKMQ